MARGKPKHKVRKYFGTGKSPEGKKIAICPYCKWTNAINATRLQEHLSIKCEKVPPTVREEVKSLCPKKKKLVQPKMSQRKRPATAFSDTDSTSSGSSGTSRPEIVVDPQPSTSGVRSFIDSMSSQEQDSLRALFAKAVYASGTPFSTFECPVWKEFFSKLRPCFKLPLRFDLAGNLLTTAYKELSATMDKKIATAKSLAVSIDGWSNCRRESIMNVIIFTPEPIFLKSIECKTNAHTGDYVADQLEQIINEKCADKFSGVVTDNASNMKKAGTKIEIKFPFISWFGCMMHCLNLLMEDICKKVGKVKEIIDVCAAITIEITTKPKLLALFVETQQIISKRCITLKTPGKTRFGSNVRCVNAIVTNQAVLRALSIDTKLISKSSNKNESLLSAHLKKELLSDEFWTRIEEVLNILKPINEWLFKVQSDTIFFSSVVFAFKDIEAKVDEVFAESNFFDAEEMLQVKEIISERKGLCLQPVHYAATLLDPMIGTKLDASENLIALDYIEQLSSVLPDIDNTKLMQEYVHFSTKQGIFAPNRLWKKMNVNAHLWWDTFARSSELGKIAVRILCLPPTSAAVERSFSAHGRIHSKVRNRLTNKRSEMLVFLHQNNKLLMNKSENEKASKEKKQFLKILMLLVMKWLKKLTSNMLRRMRPFPPLT